MKIFNSSQILIFVAIIALFLPLKAQDKQQDYLDVHNQARAAVGVGPIKWHETVAEYARKYASQRRDCRLEHSDSGGVYGENLSWNSRDMSASAAVQLWVDEKSDYSYDTNTCQPGKVCGHYTQVVWRKSEWLGCAKVRCDNGGTIVVCNYYPPGNMKGSRPY